MNGQFAELVTEDLPPLYIRESQTSDLLNPVALRYGCRIVMEYAIEPGDRVSVNWSGAPGDGSYTSVFFPVGELRPLEVVIGGMPLVIFNQGRTVTLTYSVIRGNSAAVTSQPLILYVLPVAQADLPRPFITQAPDFGEGRVLDVNPLAEFTLRINGWPLQIRGQYFWLRLRGTNANGSVFNEVYWTAPDNVVDQEISRGFYARSYSADPLKGLMDRSTLTLEFRAGLEGSQDEALAQPFAHRSYIVRTDAPITQPRPVILSVTDSLNQSIGNGGTTSQTSVRVEGSALADAEVELRDGQTVIDRTRANGGRWNFPVSGLTIGSHPFTATALYGGGDVSNSWTINVVLPPDPEPEPEPDLQLSIKEAPDNVNLDPLAATASLTAVLNYDMQPDDLIHVSWTAAPGTPTAGSFTTPAVTAGATRPREIALPVSLVAFSLGKAARVSFTYERNGAPPVPSQPLSLNVGVIPTARLIGPVIVEARGTDEFNLRDVTNGATLRFGMWPLIAVRQPLWLDLRGEDASGNSHNLSVWTGTKNVVHPLWVSSNGYSIVIAYSYLQGLRNGSTLSIRLRVNFDQVANAATAVPFAVREYTVRATP